jgi:hypothetical protein
MSGERGRRGGRPRSRYYCRHCGAIKWAEQPPAGWVRVQISDPDVAATRAAGWSSTDAGGLFCRLACLIAWATAQADASTGAEVAS